MAELTSIENPILNGPYDAPTAHFELGPNGPTGEIIPRRRPSESFIPVPAPKKGRKASAQQQIDTDILGERRERNSLVNDIRAQVELWRARRYPGVTPVSRKLLLHWADPTRENRVLFCQREAAETAIFLAEVAGRHGYPDLPTRRRSGSKTTRSRSQKGSRTLRPNGGWVASQCCSSGLTPSCSWART